jgi:hypothetical protein
MPFDKRVLFVQPETELFYAAKEAEQVINLLDANLLSGKVELDDLINRVRDFQPQLIIISSHGRDDGILLSDGIIGAEQLAPIFSTSDVECVYLNTCSGIRTALQLHIVMPVDFIFSIAEVPDRNAFITMSAFAFHLSEGLAYSSAWLESRGGSGNDFMLLPNVIKMRKPDTGDTMTVGRPKLNGDGKLEDIHDEVTKLAYVIYGDERSRFPGLIDTVMTLKKDVTFIRMASSVLIVLMALILIGGAIALIQIL